MNKPHVKFDLSNCPINYKNKIKILHELKNQGLSIDEISEIMNIPIKTIKKLIY